MELSVIIPTYNREDSLKELIESINSNNTNFNLEIICIFDSNDYDNFGKTIKSFNAKFLKRQTIKIRNKNISLLIYKSDNIIFIEKNVKTSQGICRNIGIDYAQGKFILFLDDDIRFDGKTDYIQKRITDFKKSNVEKTVSVGKIEFPKNSNPNLETKKWDIAGIMANFNSYFLPFYQCLSCNLLGLKKTFSKIRFNELFNKYGFEDVELGYRLIKSDYKIYFYKEDAIFHINHKNKKSLKKRFFDISENWIIFEALHPDIIFESETLMSLLLFNKKFLIYEHQYTKIEIEGGIRFLKSLNIEIKFNDYYKEFFPFQNMGFSKNSFSCNLSGATLTKNFLRKIYLRAILILYSNKICNTDIPKIINISNFPKSINDLNDSINMKINLFSIAFIKMFRNYINEYSFFNYKIL